MNQNKRQKILRAAAAYYTATNVCSRLNMEPNNPAVKRVSAFAEAIIGVKVAPDFLAGTSHRDVIRKLLAGHEYRRVVTYSHLHDRIDTGEESLHDLLPDEWWERGAVNALLALASEDGPLRISRCAVCSQWIFARRAGRLFCSATCRQRRYDSDPERRAAKLVYMRDRYIDRKAQAANPKSGVGLQKKGQVVR